MAPVAKTSGKSNDVITVEEVSKEAKGLIDKVIKDVGETSATKQLIIGGVSGWVTGYLMMKVGKMAAVAIGGGIILLQLANHKGYIKINWDKISKEADKVTDKIDTKPTVMDKVERFVDRKLEKAETLLKKKERKAKRWYHKAIYNEEPFMFHELHVFIASFIAGMALGIAFGGITR